MRKNTKLPALTNRGFFVVNLAPDNGDLDDSFPEALNLEMTEDLRELCADYRRFFN